jgi:hypothetical protein
VSFDAKRVLIVGAGVCVEAGLASDQTLASEPSRVVRHLRRGLA